MHRSKPISSMDARQEDAVVEVNGVQLCPGLSDGRSLLEVLREDLRLTGAKPGCGEGACGACTVLLDREPVRACVTPSSAAAGRSVTTVEGLADGKRLHRVQEALLAEGAIQCGYCTPGIALVAVALLAADPDPDDAAIRDALAGNICRCGAYGRITRAVRRAADSIRDDGGHSDVAAARPVEVVSFWDFRPHAPWDLRGVDEHELFELLGNGLAVVLVPGSRIVGGATTLALQGGGAWLHIGVDGGVTAFIGKVDVGQDNRTALALIVADELRVAPQDVSVVMGDTDLCPFDPGTFGSRSLPGAGEDLRVAAATARKLLIGLAADRFGTAEDRLEALHGHVAGDGVRVGYGEMVSDLRQIARASPDVPLTPPIRWRYGGHPAARVSAPALVTGAHRFPSDLARPDMLLGRLLRPPAYGASIRSFDLASARAIPGVTVVGEPGMVAVAAPDRATLALAYDAIDAAWDLPPQPAEEDLESFLRSHPVEVLGWEGAVHEAQGDVERALAGAELRLEGTYTTAYIAHASLETRVALAEWDEDRVTVWTGTQQPFYVRYELAAALGIDEQQVRVIVPDTGGGFGSKHAEEVAIAAARLARAAGKPVKVALRREEEFAWTYVRPAAVIDVRSGASRDGRITAWDFSNVNSGASGLASPYAVADQRISFQPAASPLPQGPYRALAATANHFARESHIDELAGALGLDALELRLRNLADERLAAVLRAAADRAGWGSAEDPAKTGTGIGIAAGTEKGGRVATCAHVAVDGDRLEILGLVIAYECGALVNPGNVRGQIEGAAVMGLGGALFEAVHFDAGLIVNASLRSYRVPRFTDVPPIEVVLLDRPDIPSSGAGETPLVAIAPAIANAVHAACGARIRSLPLLRDGRLAL